MRVRWTPEARADLTDIYEYIWRQGAPQAADSYTSRIAEFVERIGEMPHAGRSRDDLMAGLRLRPFQTVVIAYQVLGSEVHVLRIVHHALDYEHEFTRD